MVRLGFGVGVAVVCVGVVVLGLRVAYSGPEEPELVRSSGFGAERLECDAVRCFIDGVALTAAEEAALPVIEQEHLADLRGYGRAVAEYEDGRDAYRRNVFVIAGLAGVVGMAASWWWVGRSVVLR